MVSAHTETHTRTHKQKAIKQGRSIITLEYIVMVSNIKGKHKNVKLK